MTEIGAPLRAESNMKPHQVLEIAIPRGKAEIVAMALSTPRKPVSAGTVRSWRRRPESRDDPTATGRSSPLEDFLPFFIALFSGTEKGQGADVVVAFLTDLAMDMHVAQGHIEPMADGEMRDKLRLLEEITADVRRRSR